MELYKGSDRIYELRVSLMGSQYRLFGCYGPGNRKFTFLIGAVEKGNRLEPKECITIAEKRREEINADPTRTIEHE
jgi:hypothetical protein